MRNLEGKTMREDVEQGVEVELSFVLKPNWKYTTNPVGFVVSVPKTVKDAEVRAEIWKVACFVAYGSFASILRLPDGSYKFTTRDTAGAGFEILFIQQEVDSTAT